MQKITVIGNVGRPPEERLTNTGKKLVSFPLAVSVSKDNTFWYDCNIWDIRISQFQGILPHLKKGSRILIIGDLGIPETYQSKEGQTKIKCKIQPFCIQFVGSPQEDKPKEVEVKKQQDLAEDSWGSEIFNNQHLPF